METADALVVGAGIIGLAVARALARNGRDVIVLEANGAIGEETSSRNSEVIHAGIYYPPGSLMARSCVAGKRLLYAFCRDHGVAHAACGKLIVATSEAEVARLADIQARAAANGVDDLRLLSAAEARALEPELACEAALLSPSTGILDSHGYMTALQGDAEAAGAAFAFRCPLIAARAGQAGIEVDVGGEAAMTLRCRTLVNAAGLHASAVARSVEGLAPGSVPPTTYAKGSYFVLSGRSPFARLIYPVPVHGGHITRALAHPRTLSGPAVFIPRLRGRIGTAGSRATPEAPVPSGGPPPADGDQLRSDRAARPTTWAWISAAPSKMLRMRASHRTRLISNSSA